MLTSLAGMQLMKLTGGKFVATTHRVNTLKIDTDRFVPEAFIRHDDF